MTQPFPVGKKFLPTIFSRTDDFPADCEPITTILIMISGYVTNFRVSSHVSSQNYGL